MNICFVCFGNLCRSPMAEYIFKYLLKQNNINNVNVSSAGTSVRHSSLMSRGAQEQLKLHHIPFNKHYSQLFTKDIYDHNDLIIVMDNYNLSLINYNFETSQKLHLMRSFLDGDKDIFDPYHTDKYNITYEQIYNSCLGLLQYIQERKYI